MMVDSSMLNSTLTKDNYEVVDMEVTSEGCDEEENEDPVQTEEEPNTSEC